jgi:hypothetical protein
MIYNTFDVFKKFIELKGSWVAEWTAAYADSDFRDRQLVKCFYHYKDKPMSEGDWKRVIDSWFEKNWKNNSFTVSKPKFQSQNNTPRPIHTGAVDQWQPIRDQLPLTGGACPKCFSSGVIMAYKASDKQQYMFCFICNCAAGQLAGQLPENMPSKVRHWRDAEGEWINSLAKDECPY